MARRKLAWLLFASGLGQLLGRLLFGLPEGSPATRVLLDAIRVDFLPAAALLMLLCMTRRPAVGGVRLAARTLSATLVALACLGAAALAAIGFQLARGHAELQPALYAHGLLFNLGWPLLHLAALAACLHAAAGAWPAMLGASALFVGARLAFEHPLLRFGAPVGPWSNMNGYGPFLAEHVAAGFFWTAVGALLLIAAHVLRPPRGRIRERCTRQVGAAAWTAFVLAAAFAAWLVNHQPPGAVAARAAADAPQPTYARFDLQVELFPEARELTCRGVAIVVNPHAVAIPSIRFAFPQPMALVSLSLTGAQEAQGERSATYRLNRPLEPAETLRIEFQLDWRREDLPRERRGAGVLANGTFVTIGQIVPAVGPREDAAPALLRVRIGTALDQTAVAPGALTRRWKENLRSYFEYEAEGVFALDAPVFSGRYAMTRRGEDPEIYAHPPHLERLAAIAQRRSGKAATRWVEVPDYHPIFARPWPLRDAHAVAAHPARAGLLPVSERLLTTSMDQ